jgi:glycosyltransferase involved in cell wall biosynthesis
MNKMHENRNNNLPLISVIITTKNRCELLKRAIDSVLKQTYKRFEIIVVDDGSTDKTPSVVRQYLKKNSRISYLRNEESMGACHARNRGIALAEGEFVTGLDDDDEFMPNRLEILFGAYDGKWSFVCGAIKVIHKGYFTISKADSKIITYENALWKNIVGNQVLVEKSRIQDLGGFDEGLPSSQDHDMWLRLLKKYGPAFKVNEPLYIQHTEHDEPRIAHSKKRLTGYLKVYRKNKKSMSDQQKMYNLIVFRREIKKKIHFKYVMKLFGSPFFMDELIRFVKLKIKAGIRLFKG